MRSLPASGQHLFAPTQRNSAQFPVTQLSATPSTSEATRGLLCDHSLYFVSLCCLPLEIVYKVCIYLNVVSLLRLEITGKTMFDKIRVCGIRYDHSQFSKYPLVRHLYKYIHDHPPAMTSSPRAFHIPMILDFNLELMIVQLEHELAVGCQQIKHDIQDMIEHRERAGYIACAQLSYIKAQELIFLELLSARILSLKVNNKFPSPAMTVGPQGRILSTLTYPSLDCQNRGNVKKILKYCKNRSFAAAGTQLRSSLFPVTPSISRCYGYLHHSSRTEMILNLVCQPLHVVNLGAPLCLPNGEEIHPGPGPSMMAPVLIHPGSIIVNVDSDDDSDHQDGFDWYHDPPGPVAWGADGQPVAWGADGHHQLNQQQY